MKRNIARLAESILKPAMGYRHVFVYAELLHEAQFREQCHEAEFVTVAFYEGRRLFTNSDRRISIEGRAGFEVWGVIWAIPDSGLALLDLYFELPEQNDRLGCFARTQTGRLCLSEFYAARNRQRGPDAKALLTRIGSAGRMWGFPTSYLEQIASAPRSNGRRTG